MLAKEVKEWLAEYKGLSSDQIHSFACTIEVNEELILALLTLFETPPYNVQELEPVCHQLYEFYRSKEEKLQVFSLQFVPTLIWLYLRCVSFNDKKVCGGVETFLLGVYNLEIVKSDGSPVVENFRIPTISKASIYHEARIPGVTEPLTEHALRSLNNSHSLWRSGPYPQYERFNAQNRFSILSYVMQRYNNQIDSFHSHSLEALCKATINLTSTGFGKAQDSPHHPGPRIAVYPSLLVEYMVANYFAMFNGHDKIAMKAVEATHDRSAYELYSDVLLITNAMLNSHHRGNFRFENHEVNIGAQKTAQALKNTITNASFKAKKLPDDIEIVEEEDNQRLATVEEEDHSLAKGLKAKLMNIGGKLGVDKNKNREAMRRDSDTPSLKTGMAVTQLDSADIVGVAVKNTSGGGKVMVDMLEMQPMKGKGAEDGMGEGLYMGDKGKVSPTPLVFSKKSGISKQTSHGSSGAANSNSDSVSKNLSYAAPALTTLSTAATVTSISLSTSSSLSSSQNTMAFNGKGPSSSSSSSIGSSVNSMSSTIRQTPSTSKSNPPHSTRAQSEGPLIQEGSNITSVKTPPSSSPSLLASSSPASAPKNGEPGLPSNSSEPLLSEHSPQHTTSFSTHSMPAEIMANSSASKPSKKPHVNRNSFSTDL